MEGHGGSGFDNALMKKRRSCTSRRPRPETNLVVEQRDISSSSSMSSRSNSKKAPLEENVVSDGGLRQREFYLNDPPQVNVSKRTTESALSPVNLRSSNKTKGSNQLHSGPSDGHSRNSVKSYGIPESAENHDLSTNNKPRKMKLKIGGITCTISTKPNSEMSGSSSPFAKHPQPVDLHHRHRHGRQIGGSNNSSMLTSLQEKKRKKERLAKETLAREQPNKIQREPSPVPVRKSRRLAKKPFLDGELDDNYDAISLEKVENSGDAEGRSCELTKKEESSAKKSTLKRDKSRTMAYEVDNDFVMSRSNRDGKKRSRESTEEEATSASELEAKNKKQKEHVDSPANVRTEPLTTRRRALQSWADGSSDSTIEFPDSLLFSQSRTAASGKKEKLSEEEMLARKAEAAQRRRMQVEKANREIEAEAIRKILGMDSDKKKEEKKQKEREEMERASRAQKFTGSTIRWVMGPTGTVVSFPDEVGLPSILNSKPCSYPPPQEKCAGPSCTNAYRYRDSKLNLPVCSLKCYKAVHESA